MAHLAGEAHPSATLTADGVRAIRLALKRGVKPAALAIQFAVSLATISKIRNRKSWRTVR